jgi:PAS domain S-box-containing protein
MAGLAELVEEQAESLLSRWLVRLREGVASGGETESELRDHVPALLTELSASLRRGRTPDVNAVAKTHGRQRYRIGFDVDALVREYGLLRNCIFDLVEEAQTPLSLAEVRVLTDFITDAIAEGIAEHTRQRELKSREQESELRSARAERDSEREKLHSLFMQSPVPVAILEGPEHVFTLANPAYRALVNGRDVVGKPLLEALPDVKGMGFDTLLDQVMESGETFVGQEVPIVLEHHAEGESLILNFVYTPKRTPSGEIDGVLMSGNDVTELVTARRRMEALAEEVRISEAELRRVTDALPVLVSLVTVEERYSLVNKAYEAWFGLPQAELVGKSVRELIGEAAYAILGPSVQRALAGEAFSFEQYQVPYRHGGPRDVKVTFIPHLDKANVVDGYVALLEDITQRRGLEAERERFARNTLRQAEFEKQLIGIVSHDLRNPLNVIVLAANLLRSRNELSESASKHVARIQNACERASRLVRDVLDFTQARLGGGIRMELLPADLHALCKNAIDELRVAHPAREIALRQEGDGLAALDADRITQVVDNLVSNALKYSPVDSKVQVLTQTADNQIRITVHNLGAPIPADKLDTLFEPFQRAVGSVDRAGRSVGLGLYIVKHVVEAHHGLVNVRSNASEGTTFTVELPRV